MQHLTSVGVKMELRLEQPVWSHVTDLSCPSGRVPAVTVAGCLERQHEQLHLDCLPVVKLRLWGLLTLASRWRFGILLGKGVCVCVRALVYVRKPVASFILRSILEARERNASEKRTKDPVHMRHYEDAIVWTVFKAHFVSVISISVKIVDGTRVRCDVWVD